LPKAIREARKSLYGPMNDAKIAGKPVKFVGKQLFIDGQLYRPGNSDSATSDLIGF
jgi:hypothetical protein